MMFLAKWEMTPPKLLNVPLGSLCRDLEGLRVPQGSSASRVNISTIEKGNPRATCLFREALFLYVD